MSLKDGLFWLLSFGADLENRAVILMYHSIAAQSAHFNAISEEEFSRQMQYIKEQNYTVISLSELVRRLRARENLGKSVAITFDDGYRNNYSEAYPILKAHNFPATIFVVTDRIGGEDYLSYEQLLEMEKSRLIYIEPHSKTHSRLAKVEDSVAREEMQYSKAALEKLLEKKCSLFAYPYGSFTKRTAHIAKECGFAAAVTVREGTIGGKADLFLLPRVSIDATTTMTQFCGKLSRAVDRYEALKLWR